MTKAVLLLQGILEEQGYTRIQTTTDPRRALPLYVEFQPDLILLDLRMPRIDGFGVMEQLQTVIPPEAYIPIIILTADITRQAKTHALQMGAKDFLTKPLDHLEVLLRIRNLLETRALHLRQQTANDILEETVRERTAELTQSNAALIRVNRELQEANNLKSSFISVISHELRTPFTVIFLALEMIEREGLESLQPDQQQMFIQLQDNVQSAHRMIENLIKFAGLVREQESMHMEFLDIHSVIDKVFLGIRDEAEHKELALEVNLPDDLPIFNGHEERLGDAVKELVKNAVKFTPAGGKIALCCWVEQNVLHLSVQDTGPGIPPERLSGLWESFAQMADPLLRGREGLGLGLALVQYIVRAHKGEVWAESQLGVGSTFGFRIPVT